MAETESKNKTKTIKQRLIYVYLPSQEMVEQWKSLADRSGCSISKFVMEHVENSIHLEEDKGDYQSRVGLIDQIKELKDENKTLVKKIQQLDTLIDRYDKELKDIRMKPFLDEGFSGVRTYEKALIDVFRLHGEIRKERLLELLEIKPMETDKVKAITRQLDNLEQYGVIKDIGGKWRWKP
jgi:hypothetical protein